MENKSYQIHYLPIFEQKFEPYHSSKKRNNPYYQIYVRNYVVIDDVMEVQCLPYGSTDTDKYL